MTEPTLKDITEIKSIISKSLKQLIEKDPNLFTIDPNIKVRTISESVKKLNRKLHEICINHRFAHYLENELEETNHQKFKNYNVDIEYNRFYKNFKVLNTSEGKLNVRPDIIVHARIDDTIIPQHLLVIETKKEEISDHDKNKIRGFINDKNYYYMFGLTVSYRYPAEQIEAVLYYYQEGQIREQIINYDKIE